MSSLHVIFGLLVSLLLNVTRVAAVELTFELPDSAKECFHEHIEVDTESTLEFQVKVKDYPQCWIKWTSIYWIWFQVVTGGHYDVDVVLTDPTRKVLYKEIKKQYDRWARFSRDWAKLLSFVCFSFNWKAEKTGEYIACFSNEFSTFSHKLVYIDFQVIAFFKKKIWIPKTLSP